MAYNQPRNSRQPRQPGPGTIATSGSSSNCDAARYSREVPSYESDESASSQDLPITVSEMEYAVFMKGYRLMEKNFGILPEYRGICERLQLQAHMARRKNCRMNWTSFFNPGLECSYMDALHEFTHLLATMMLFTRQDRDAMRDIVRLANDVVDHRRTFQPPDQDHRLTIRKWEHMRDTLRARV